MVSIFVLFALMVVSGSVGAPVAESPRSCIERAEVALASVEVPARIGELVQQLRQMHPILQHFSLIKFADSEQVDLRLIETGLVKASEMEALVSECAAFVAKAYPVGESGAHVCNLEQFTNDYAQYESFLEEAAKHSDYDRKIGAAKLCIQF